ncbi:MAG: penicillin-binding protein 2 [Candidatus Taylorbacteria bacterium]
MNYNQRIRARIVYGIVIILALVLAIKLYTIQIVKGQIYAAKADKQYIKPGKSQFDRGTIFFQSKDGTKAAAATMGSGYLVYMNPSQVKDAEQTYEALSQYIKLDKNDFIAKANNKKDLYDELAHRVDSSIATSIRSLSLTGIGILKETWRIYPGNTTAAHELGIIGQNSSGLIEGRYGLESMYESTLSRVGNRSSTINVFAQLFSGVKDAVFGGPNNYGDIVTTIEPSTQKYLETVLSSTLIKWNPDEIGGIVIDPSTGEIIAMASLPSFNPNDTSLVENANIFSNPLVEHVYEMGSIMKPLTMAMALDTGVETIDSTYDDTGTLTLNTKKISNYDGKARGVIPMQQILSQSLNVGAATIAMNVEHTLGTATMFKYFSNYGFGQKTGIDQPNEATGIISNLKSGRDIEIATAAYGQGIAVSPVEMVRGLSILANGGYMITPHLVKKIDLTDGTSKLISIEKKGPVLKKVSVDQVTGMLIKVVDDVISKAHPDIHFENYSVAAKTGTAQIADHVNGGYYADKYLHSFFGYFPAYSPKYLVFLYQVYPKGAQYASDTLTDPFSEITKFLIDYYNIAPDR